MLYQFISQVYRGLENFQSMTVPPVDRLIRQTRRINESINEAATR